MLDKVNNPEVENWQLSLVKRSFNTLGSYEDEIIKTTKLPKDINYIFIPVKFRKMGYPTYYLVNVAGYSSSETVVVSENNIHLNDFNNVNDDLVQANGGFPYIETPCRKTCIGDLYAYSIQQFKRQDIDLSRFRVVHAYKAFDTLSQTANPYYWYSTIDQGSSVWNPTYQIQVKSGIDGHVTQVDPSGVAITGLIWGYQKGLGVWEGQSEIETNGNFIIGDEFCGNISHTLNTAINLMNSSADFSRPAGMLNYPLLECLPADLGGGGGYIPLENPNPQDVIADFFDSFCLDSLGYPIDCDNDNNTGGGGFGWLDLEVIDQIIITDLNNTSNPPVAIDVLELFNTNNENGGVTNGEFNGFNIALAPSLYSFGFMFKAEGYYNKIIEFKTAVNFTLSQADMVDITVFPSPLTGNKFDIKTKAYTTLKFTYELRDFTGELLLTKNFMEHKDHESVRKINAKNIPKGIMLHRFIFEDGSVKTIQTLKN